MKKRSKRVISSPLSAKGRIRHLCGGMGEDTGGGAVLLSPHPYLPPRGGKETYEIWGSLRSLAMTFVFALIITWSVVCFAEEIPFRIDGRVIRVDEAKRILVMDYENPASGKHIEKELTVPEDCGFKDFKKLNQLQKDDLISLDYFDYKPLAKAIYIIKIPLEKTYFTQKEIAGALLKIKSAHPDANAPKN